MDISLSSQSRSVEFGFSKTPEFIDVVAYRAYCHGVVEAWRKLAAQVPSMPTFSSHRAAIERGGLEVIQTGWGGVNITKHEHPQVEKFLVVDSGKFLAFEKHEEKLETLNGREGYGILVFRPEGESKLVAELIEPGWSRTLKPGQEHTIIALTDLLVFESSVDPKGMDQDLIFIFMPE